MPLLKVRIYTDFLKSDIVIYRANSLNYEVDGLEGMEGV